MKELTEFLSSIPGVAWIFFGISGSIILLLRDISRQLAAIFNTLFDIRERLNLSLPRHPLEDVEDDPDAQMVINELRRA